MQAAPNQAQQATNDNSSEGARLENAAWYDQLNRAITPLELMPSKNERQSPFKAYHSALRSRLIRANPYQEQAVEALEQLYHQINENIAYQSSFDRWQRRSFFGRLVHAKPKLRDDDKQRKGLYLHGTVGIGKTMLMDFIANSLPERFVLRVHFHAFMFAVHERLHQLRNANKSQDPLIDLADELADAKILLCLDEFIVNNIADAMLMARLFERLFQRGLFLVTTSNAAPSDLYKNGLQRKHFLPFIALLEEQVLVLELKAPQDYRRGLRLIQSLYLSPLNRANESRLFDCFRALASDIATPHVQEQQPSQIDIRGRKIQAVATKGPLAFFRFSQLCSEALAAQDYQWLCENFSTFLIADIPQLSDDRRSEVRRFITMIDVLYDHHKLCIFSAASPIEQIYIYGQDKADFERCLSRVNEMQSQDYITKIDPRFVIQE